MRWAVGAALAAMTWAARAEAQPRLMDDPPPPEAPDETPATERPPPRQITDGPTEPAPAVPSAPVPVRFERDPDSPSGELVVWAQGQRCTLPCTLTLAPVPTEVGVSGAARFVRVIQVPDHPAVMRVRRRDRDWIGLCVTGVVLGGVTTTVAAVLTLFYSATGERDDATRAAIVATAGLGTMIVSGVGFAFAGSDGVSPAPERSTARASRPWVSAGLAPLPGGAAAGVGVSF